MISQGLSVVYEIGQSGKIVFENQQDIRIVHMR